MKCGFKIKERRVLLQVTGILYYYTTINIFYKPHLTNISCAFRKKNNQISCKEQKGKANLLKKVHVDVHNHQHHHHPHHHHHQQHIATISIITIVDMLINTLRACEADLRF